jgi:hypothetical protein
MAIVVVPATEKEEWYVLLIAINGMKVRENGQEKKYCCLVMLLLMGKQNGLANKKADHIDRLKKYPGWESNPHLHCCKQDFKSCVSTSSTTRVAKKNPDIVGTFWSGRPGSNRPPRPWQGRALPNELLPHTFQELSPFFGSAKIRVVS